MYCRSCMPFQQTRRAQHGSVEDRDRRQPAETIQSAPEQRQREEAEARVVQLLAPGPNRVDRGWGAEKGL
eukprot:CAMPEP_0203961446 /NCGR_PEP_ID=MMETSP0359-20131031/91887_1 /ASSEMBLY_ACC=CAM_ASM_000338 /TAXON_ID=268821 /ORGANISM="Scrippsiella Hangoei, Strain SHTV-5" /LENGTH=69 /DNA_ID=CAMNT_0050896279 /DNA_START=11 /DNA_END=216 /DNA_ORIENTATION=+